MPKKLSKIRKYEEKKVMLEPIYRSYWYSKFVNKLMLNGKKHIVEKIMYNSIFPIKKIFKTTLLTLLFITFNKTKPLLGSTDQRRGRTKTSCPIPLDPRTQLIKALNWTITAIRITPKKKLKIRVLHLLLNFHKSPKKNILIGLKKTYIYTRTKERINLRFRWR